MVVYGRGDSLWGPFENYPCNPVLTNRDLGGYTIQGVGHGNLVQSPTGEWFVVHLGFRQTDMWMPYHHLGREVCMTPVRFGDDGWFTCGNNGMTEQEYEINSDIPQNIRNVYTFANTSPDVEWCYPRHPDTSKYELSSERFVLRAGEHTLDDAASPTFIGIRQMDFCGTAEVEVTVDCGEAGLTMFMDENHYYDLMLRSSADSCEAILKLNIGDVKHEQFAVPVSSCRVRLSVELDNLRYTFRVIDGDCEIQCGSAQTRYLSSEVAGGFTGVFIGLFAQKNGCTAQFADFRTEYR